MPEYRYTGVNVTGRRIQGTVFSPDDKTVKNQIDKLVKKKGVRIDALEKKSVFLYKVQRAREKPRLGEQKAFSKAEVETALQKMGYRVHYVRKKLFNFSAKVPSKDLILFIRICSDLLKENFPFDEILTLVSEDTDNKRLRDTIRDIQSDLKAGSEGQAVFSKHSDVFGTFAAHMMAVASTSGNMAAVYESTAKFLERDDEFKANIRRVMFMPAFVTVGMIAAVGFYIAYIFPQMTDMLVKYKIEVPPMTAATMQLSNFLQDNWGYLAAIFIIPILLLVNYLRTEKGKYAFDRAIIRVPVVGQIMQKTSIEIFSRVFHSLYSSSGENITAIRVAAESCRNRYIEKQITAMVIPKMLKEGKSFVECLVQANCFTLTAVRRLRSGEESGTLRATALQLANYYEQETKHKMAKLVDIINLGVSIIITLMVVGLTLVSSEIGFVSPPSPLTR